LEPCSPLIAVTLSRQPGTSGRHDAAPRRVKPTMQLQQ
jgi:hypothetical protein